MGPKNANKKRASLNKPSRKKSSAAREKPDYNEIVQKIKEWLSKMWDGIEEYLKFDDLIAPSIFNDDHDRKVGAFNELSTFFKGKFSRRFLDIEIGLEVIGKNKFRLMQLAKFFRNPKTNEDIIEDDTFETMAQTFIAAKILIKHTQEREGEELTEQVEGKESTSEDEEKKIDPFHDLSNAFSSLLLQILPQWASMVQNFVAIGEKEEKEEETSDEEEDKKKSIPDEDPPIPLLLKSRFYVSNNDIMKVMLSKENFLKIWELYFLNRLASSNETEFENYDFQIERVNCSQVRTLEGTTLETTVTQKDDKNILQFNNISFPDKGVEDEKESETVKVILDYDSVEMMREIRDSGSEKRKICFYPGVSDIPDHTNSILETIGITSDSFKTQPRSLDDSDLDKFKYEVDDPISIMEFLENCGIISDSLSNNETNDPPQNPELSDHDYFKRILGINLPTDDIQPFYVVSIPKTSSSDSIDILTLPQILRGFIDLEELVEVLDDFVPLEDCCVLKYLLRIYTEYERKNKQVYFGCFI